MSNIIVINRSVTPHFQYSDFACHCCGVLKLSDLFFKHMATLEKLRLRFNQPIFINSGYRCPVHNKAIGGELNSWHLRFATDIRPAKTKDLDELYNLAVKIGFTGIGRYDTFVHVDCRPTPARWDYRTAVIA